MPGGFHAQSMVTQYSVPAAQTGRGMVVRCETAAVSAHVLSCGWWGVGSLKGWGGDGGGGTIPDATLSVTTRMIPR